MTTGRPIPGSPSTPLLRVILGRDHTSVNAVANKKAKNCHSFFRSSSSGQPTEYFNSDIEEGLMFGEWQWRRSQSGSRQLRWIGPSILWMHSTLTSIRSVVHYRGFLPFFVRMKFSSCLSSFYSKCRCPSWDVYGHGTSELRNVFLILTFQKVIPFAVWMLSKHWGWFSYSGRKYTQVIGIIADSRHLQLAVSSAWIDGLTALPVLKLPQGPDFLVWPAVSCNETMTPATVAAARSTASWNIAWSANRQDCASKCVHSK